jgi:hypothetical protein
MRQEPANSRHCRSFLASGACSMPTAGGWAMSRCQRVSCPPTWVRTSSLGSRAIPMASRPSFDTTTEAIRGRSSVSVEVRLHKLAGGRYGVSLSTWRVAV